MPTFPSTRRRSSSLIASSRMSYSGSLARRLSGAARSWAQTIWPTFTWLRALCGVVSYSASAGSCATMAPPKRPLVYRPEVPSSRVQTAPRRALSLAVPGRAQEDVGGRPVAVLTWPPFDGEVTILDKQMTVGWDACVRSGPLAVLWLDSGKALGVAEALGQVIGTVQAKVGDGSDHSGKIMRQSITNSSSGRVPPTDAPMTMIWWESTIRQYDGVHGLAPTAAPAGKAAACLAGRAHCPAGEEQKRPPPQMCPS